MKQKFIHLSLFLLVSVMLVGVVSFAGSLTPPGSPSKTMKSLSDLYQLINTGANTPSTDFTTPGTIAPTMNTIGDTYDLLNTKIGLIDTSKANILTGTSFFGIAGTMTNNGAITITPSAVDQAIPVGYHDGSGIISGDADFVVENIKSGVSIFGVIGSASGPGLPKTGQTTCYDQSGGLSSCSSSPVGQDGYYQEGIALSYTDNLDGTISDGATGLMWKKCSEGKSYSGGSCTGTNVTQTLQQSLDACEADTTASYTDWRLPNIRELLSIADYERTSPAINPLFDTQVGYYRTSTTYKGTPRHAWVVNFSDGNLGYGDRIATFPYARCVR